MSEMKKCSDCKLEKDVSAYYNDKQRSDGKMKRCKECMKKKSAFWEENKKKKDPLAKFEQPEFKIGERARDIVEAYISNPKITYDELAEKLGVPRTTIAFYHKSNDYVRAIRLVAQNKITQMIPKALKTLDHVMEFGTSNTQFQAAVKVLENENVVGPARVDINVTDWRALPIERLQEMMAQAKAIPAQTIDAEIVHD